MVFRPSQTQRPYRMFGLRVRLDRFGPIAQSHLTPATMATSPTTSSVGRSREPVSSESGMVPPLVHIDGSDRVVRTVGTNLSNGQRKHEINRLLGSTPPEIRTAYHSTHRLPYEIVGMIIAHLTRNLNALKACSLTCRSWYTVAVPHIHHTLTLRDKRRDESRCGLKPLYALHGFGLAPLIKEIRVSGKWPVLGAWFVPQALSPDGLRHFSAFANVQTLVLRAAQIDKFIPGIERYFGHFSSTLRSIVLVSPSCTPRQLSHFFSLFSNLDNIHITFPERLFSATVPDTELVPFSAPKLGGRLELRGFYWTETWTNLIASCGGLRFHYMDLSWTRGCAPLLLGACAETLETLICLISE